ncbi:Oidioi.mRNA.OKI2018_I69.XSR.g15889.t1.cds [Oikopleura dioica]|uniref:Oidioi.mRNA.OKI2018_I69.XSR.g15889.t1.cds n=1 Tax=Oikopleura dioica TaxID=34765 RepID=A0ABN7SIJ1_OIKDI|nr:Oidioi.mRNA.OKI2018_I69.XSR.g15889.t1.cds [Oikopleura dioica]
MRHGKVEFSIACLVVFYYVSHGLHELESRSSAIHRRQRLPRGVKDNLKEGWKYVSRKKDGDDEWDSFCALGIVNSSVAIASYICLSGLITNKLRRVKNYFENDIIRVLISLASIGYLFSWKYLVLTLLLPILILCQNSLVPDAAVNFAMIVSVLLGSFYFPHIIEQLNTNSTLGFLAVPMVVMLVFRCYSFCFESRKALKVKDTIDYFSYVFYLPTFISGPVIPYDSFKSADDRKFKNFFSEMLWTFLRLTWIFSLLFLFDYCLHYIYLFSVTEELAKMTPTSVVLLMVLLVVFDWAKCFFIYEIVKSIMAFDGHEGPAFPPVLCSISTFADTYFDRTLHFWVSRYLYDPRASKGFISETIGAMLTFVIVWLSQGMSWTVGIWAIVNFLGLQLESLMGRTFGDEFDRWRLKSLLLGVNYFLILLANLTGIIGVSKTTKLLSYFAKISWSDFATVILILYCYTVLNYYRQNRSTAAKRKIE